MSVREFSPGELERGQGPDGWALGRMVDAAIAVVADELAVTREEILSESHSRTVALARHMAMYLARLLGRESPGASPSYPELGRAFGRDHTTVIDACRKIERLRQKDGRLDDLLRIFALRLAPIAPSPLPLLPLELELAIPAFEDEAP